MSKITSELNTERLAVLYKVNQTFNSTLELDEVLVHVIDAVIEITKAERGFLMMRNEFGALEFKAARGIDDSTVSNPEFNISRSIVEKVANTGEALLTSDASEDFATSTSVLSLNLRSILCVPLQHKETMLGVIYVDNRFATNVFTNGDLELLIAVATTAATAIENARLYKMAIENARIERELQVAQQVQRSLIPEGSPEIPGWEINGYWKPAREVSGDFYDFIQRKHKGNRTGIVVADVVDKGVAAALFMAFSRSVLRTSLFFDKSAAECICDMNETIYADAAYGMFVTLAYLEIDPATQELIYVNAGHNPPYHYQPISSTITPLERTGKLIGVLENVDYHQRQVEIDSGDFIVAYTDGITEAANKAEKEFGDERLQAVIHEADASTSAAKLSHMILDALAEFTRGAHQSDDITLVILKKL